MVVLHGKCIIAGDCTVGKTAITQSFSNDGTNFPKSYSMTTNVDVVSKFVYLDKSNKQIVDIFLFDTSGKDVFKGLTEMHYEKLGMYVLVFDVTNKDSFNNIQKWMKVLKQYIEPDKSIPGILLGNKIDLTQRRKITTESAKMFASNNGLTYFECSAKDYEGVEAPFRWLAERFYKLHEESPELIQQME